MIRETSIGIRYGIREGLLQFYRNGRWGDCGECPRDMDGHIYPEFCIHTKRYDHNLKIDGLANQINIDIKENNQCSDLIKCQ